jgi:Fe-S oxidoreductase
MNARAESVARFQQITAGLAGRAKAPVGSDGERVERAKAAFRRRLNAGMAMNLECCLHCGMCAEACHFYESTQESTYAPIHKVAPLRRFYLRELAPLRWLNRIFVRDTNMSELEEWQPLVFDACTECGRCDMICPMGIEISPMIGVMREALTEAGLMPAELAGASAEQVEDGRVLGADAAKLDVVVARLRGQGVDVPVDKDRADVMVLTTALELELWPDALAAMARVISATGANWTLRRAAFEASGFEYFSGNERARRAATKQIIDEARACGAKTLIVPECGHAYPALRWKAANDLGEPLPFEVLAISEFIGREIDAGRLKLKKAPNGSSVTYHDPCKIGRLGGVIDEPRVALNALGVELREMESHGKTQYCCGGGAGVMLIERAAPLRKRAFEIKMRQVDDSGADAVVTSCESCRMNFAIGAENSNWQKQIRSLVEMVADNLEGETS